MFFSNYLKTQEPSRIVGDYQVDLTFSEGKRRVTCVTVTKISAQTVQFHTDMRRLLNDANEDVLVNLFGWHRPIPHEGDGQLVFARDFCLTTRIGLNIDGDGVEVVVSEPCAPGLYDRLLVKVQERLREAKSELIRGIDDEIANINNILDL